MIQDLHGMGAYEKCSGNEVDRLDRFAVPCQVPECLKEAIIHQESGLQGKPMSFCNGREWAT